MAKNQSTYTLRIDAELGNLQRILSQAQSSLQSFMATGSAPKGLEKAFEKIRDLLGQIQDKTGKPLDLKGLTGTGKSLDSVQESFSAIIRLLGEFDNLSDDLKLSFLTTEDKKRIESITASLQKYQATLVSIGAQEKKLEATKKTQTKDSGTISRVSKKISDTTSKKEGLEAKRSTKRGQLEALTALGDKADPVKVAKLQGEIGQLNVEIGQLDKSLQEVNEELETAQASFASSSQEVERLEKSIKKTSGDTLKELKAEAEKLGISLDGLNGHEASEQMKRLTERMSQFKTEIANGAKPAFEEIRKGCKKGGDAAQKMGEDVEQAVEAVKEMDDAIAQRDAFEAKIKQFLGLQGAAQLLRAALRDAMSTITELDATMTQMAVVTDLTVGDYWDQLPEYSKQASELGVSINSAYEAATLYYQQGLKGNEVTKISAETLKLAKIANLDAADATDKMTAALRGFNMELDQASAQKISDVYSKLAAITAADVDEISSAMTKTASIASSAGMEFETTAAFLSQIIETTRESAETAGTAMKTVIARFQELKKDPKDIGEVDGEIVDANAIETALRSVGVSLRDASGQFRDLDDVFLELSSKWNTLDKNTQRYIATIAAGSRQQSRFIAMMQDYGRTQELVTAANNSAGASQKQFEKTMESLESKVEKLKNAWHEFTMGIMNSNFVKFGVDVLTKFLEVINKATSGIEGLGGSLVKIVSVLGVFKLGQKIFQKFKAPIVQLFADIVKEAGLAGEKSAEAYKNGIQKAKEQQSYTSDKEKRAINSKKERTPLQSIGDTTIGLDKWQAGINSFKDNKDAKKHLTEISKLRSKKMRQQDVEDAKRGVAVASGTSDFGKATANLKKAQKSLKEYENAEQKVKESSTSAWAQISSAISQTGQTISGVGVGLSAIGGILSSLGLEEAGELFTELGNGAILLGTAISGVGKALSLIPPLLTVISMHPIIAIIVAVLAVVLVTIVAITKALNNISPESKLKKAEEAAQKAGEAAEEAKEAYQELTNVLDELPDKYSALEELTKGTREWNKALMETNNQVLDLIKAYPELSEYVKNVDGLLVLDTNQAEVQDVLNKSLENSVLSNILSLKADQNVVERQLDVNRSNLKDYEDFMYASTVQRSVSRNGPTYYYEEPTYKNLTDEQIDKYAKAFASGQLTGEGADLDKFRQELGLTEDEFSDLQARIIENEDAILQYGRAILEKERQEKVLYDTMASSIVNLVDTIGMSEERVKQMFNIVDGDYYKKAYAEMSEKLTDQIILGDTSEGGTGKVLSTTGLTEQQMKEAFTAAGYTDGVLDVKKDKIVFKDDSGNLAEEHLETSEIREILSNYYSSTVVKNRAELFDVFATDFSNKIGQGKGVNIQEAFEKAMMDDSGDNLTASDLELLEQLTKEDYSTYFNQLPQAIKDLYENVDLIYEDIQSAMTSASFVKESGFEGVTYGAARGLTKIRQALDQDTTGDFTAQFNSFITTLDENQKKYFAQQIASVSSDPSNREAWESALERLVAEGIDASVFVEQQVSALDARYSDSYLASIGASEVMISKYAQAQGEDLDRFHETFKKWRRDYDTVNSESAKADHELMTRTIEAIIESREKQIDAYEEAVNAEAEANSNLISKISDNVAKLRELRELEETEKAIQDNSNKLAFLGMDTSGINALETLSLQKTNEELLQDYEDTLIDQALSKLEEDNDKALRQREQQIELMREQLESYSTSGQILEDAKRLIDEASDALLRGEDLEGTALGKLLTTDDLQTEFSKAEFWTALVNQLNTRQGKVEVEENGQAIEKTKSQALNDIVTQTLTNAGPQKMLTTEQYTSAKESYTAKDGDAYQFDSILSNLGVMVRENRGGDYTHEKVTGYNRFKSVFNFEDLADGKQDQGVITFDGEPYHLTADGKSKITNLDKNAYGDIEVVELPGTNKAKLYVNMQGTGYEIIDAFDRNRLLTKLGLTAYKTGGLVDFTGPAWLDGTPERPEYILNANQTERLFSLVDVLEGYQPKEKAEASSGDNYFDINISVESIEDDYDVEQMADKIRRMIYDDATYRNVNAINHIR